MDTLTAQRRATEVLIQEEGRDIALTRPPVAVPDGEGGVVRDGAPTLLPPARRFFGAIMRQGEHIVTREGQQFVTGHVIIGLPEDDIREGDYFDLSGHRYYVQYVQPNQDYQTKAFVTRHASP